MIGDEGEKEADRNDHFASSQGQESKNMKCSVQVVSLLIIVVV